MTRQTKTLFRTVFHLCHHHKVDEMNWNKRPACFHCLDTGWRESDDDPLTVVPCSCQEGRERAETFQVKPERTADELEAMKHHPSAYGKAVIREMKNKLN